MDYRNSARDELILLKTLMKNSTPNFAPNSDNKRIRRILFSGRTEDLNYIFDLISSGNCIALYGERRCGKTLTLEIIQDIVNNSFPIGEEEFKDRRFVSSLPHWRGQISGTNSYSIYITLGTVSTEEDVCRKFLDAARGANWIEQQSQNLHQSKSLRELLHWFQSILNEHNHQLIVLLDEIEGINDIAGNPGHLAKLIFRDRVDYSRITFICAGSYYWHDQIKNHIGNTHFTPYYLKSANKSDLQNSLLLPLKEDWRSFVIEQTGGKPLYVQSIGRILENKKRLISQDELLDEGSLAEFIRASIYREPFLGETSSNILSLLVRHPGVKEKWIVKQLQPKTQQDIKDSLLRLVNFGTIEKFPKGEYRIVGSFIERCGTAICDDLAKTSSNVGSKLPKKLIWVAFAIVFGLAAFFLYDYLYPPTNSKAFRLSEGILTMEVPESVESGEAGKFTLCLKNTSKRTIKSFVMQIESDSVSYTNARAEVSQASQVARNNSFTFQDVSENVTACSEVSYQVYTRKDTTQIIASSVKVNSSSFTFQMERRMFPLRRWQPILIGVLTILSTAFGPMQVLLSAFNSLSSSSKS